MWSALAGQMDKVSFATSTASGKWPVGGNFCALVLPDIEGEQSSPDSIFCSDQEFESFGGGN
jgi:hypothetical protein